jgi:hypothetical protein
MSSSLGSRDRYWRHSCWDTGGIGPPCCPLLKRLLRFLAVPLGSAPVAATMYSSQAVSRTSHRSLPEVI